jgi:spermidine synthase
VVNDDPPRDTALALGAPLFAAALLSAAYEIGARQTDAYLGPGLATPRGIAVGLTGLGLLTGYVCGARWSRRVTSPGDLVLRLVMALCLLCSASAPLWFWAFAAPKAMPWVACSVPSGAGLLAGAALGALVQASALPYRELQSVRLVLAPVPLAGALALALLVSTALSYLGVWRAAATLAGALAVLCSLIFRWRDYWGDLREPARWPSIVALAAAGVSFAAAQAFVPASLLARYPVELVWADAEADTVVISAQNTFELFEAQQLRTSSADDYRLAELAVHPALSGLPSRRRVLVLGPAGGFLEREVLRYPDVLEVVSLSEADRSAFRRSLWPELTFREIYGDTRLRFVSAEPMPWLEQNAQSFDQIVICLAGPASAAEGKYYTRYFYQLLARHLEPSGVLVVQATSREALPGTFASVLATLSSAGLIVSSYEAPIPLLGAVSFLVGSRVALFEPEAQTLPHGLRFLDLAALRRATSARKTAPLGAEISTLAHQRAVVTWHVEQARLGN